MSLNFFSRKQLVLILILNLSFLKMYGQSYFSFIDTNSTWRDIRLECAHGPSYSHNFYYDVQENLKGDTVIAGKMYTKIHMTGVRQEYLYDHGFELKDTIYYCNDFIGGLREDSLKTVFYYNVANGSEKMLYKFNVNVGDTVFNYYTKDTYIQGYYPIVTSIDSVLISNYYRKRINYANGNVSIIEGIGSNFGLLGINHSTNNNWICGNDGDRGQGYFYNDTMAYIFPYPYHPLDSNNTLLECSFVGMYEYNKLTTKFYPNPVKDILHIDFTDRNNTVDYVSIIDCYGRIIIKQSINSKSNNINVSMLSNGIYYVNVIEKDGYTSTFKIIKTN